MKRKIERRIYNIILKKHYAEKLLKKRNGHIHYGCGKIRINSYLNVDIRWTSAVDILADLKWCAKNLEGQGKELYLCHVLEHYGYPGIKERRDHQFVLGALTDINKILKKNGLVRISVPNFRALAELYINNNVPLYPNIISRVCGGQGYRENLHKCVFDIDYIELCLLECGFKDIAHWNPEDHWNLKHFKRSKKDDSYDSINGISTSLNIIAQKI